MKNSIKKLALSALAATSALCGFAQTTKSCDLGITLTAPTAGSVYNFGDQISISFNIINNGPDAIAANDTIFLSIAGSITATTGNAVPAGSTATVDLGPALGNQNTTGNDETVDLCVSIVPQSNITVNGNPATVTYNDPVTTNDESCSSVTLKTQPVGIFDTKGTKASLSLFPNPATSQVSFNLVLEKAETVSAIVRDLTGRTVLTKDFGQMPTGNIPALELNIMNLNSGIYVVEVMAGDKKFMGKVTKKD